MHGDGMTGENSHAVIRFLDDIFEVVAQALEGIAWEVGTLQFL
jgi:hypothetical protein